MHTLKDSRACRRNASGSLLVEVIIAMFVASLFAAAIMQMYVQIFEVGTRSQDQIMVGALAQECIDTLRSLPIQRLQASIGQHDVAVSGTSSGDALFTRPLLEDTSNFTYSSPGDTHAGGTNVFQVTGNTVTVDIQNAADNSVQINITIPWSDSTGSHTYQTSTLITSNGLNG